MTPTHKKGWKEDLGSYRPVSMTSVPGKVTDQITLSAITQQENRGIRLSQRGFRRGRSYLPNLICFHDKGTCLVDEENAVEAPT